MGCFRLHYTLNLRNSNVSFAGFYTIRPGNRSEIPESCFSPAGKGYLQVPGPFSGQIRLKQGIFSGK